MKASYSFTVKRAGIVATYFVFNQTNTQKKDYMIAYYATRSDFCITVGDNLSIRNSTFFSSAVSRTQAT
jgi:hypothetical protein